jgi:nucleoside-diphosphate-sugar epimerase
MVEQSRHVLITGAEGFIGRYVRSALAATGENVISVDSKVPSSSIQTSHQCDITDGERVKEIFASRPIGCVVHLASQLRTASVQNPKTATEVNILGTLNILEAAREFKVRRVVYSSSISVYGSQKADAVNELEAAAPEDVYAAAKTYVEVLGAGYARKYGIKFVALRVPVAVGSGATGTSSPWRSEMFERTTNNQKREIKIPHPSSETLSLVHVQDLADMLAILVRAPVLSFSAYNAPCEIWRLDELKTEVELMNENLQIRFGESTFDGGPHMINADRFRKEFNYSPVSLKGRLREAHRSR